MFSGIVEEKALVAEISKVDPLRIVVQSSLNHSKTLIGDSISINGVCLTVVDNQSGTLAFDLLEETLRCTCLGQLSPGSFVNLERSLKIGDRVHGHFVFGHVDQVITLKNRSYDGTSHRLLWTLPESLRALVVQKGSVSINGVSLTVGEVSKEDFSVYIIPHTANLTVLGEMVEGQQANLEVDMLARYVQAQIGARGSQDILIDGITPEFLRQHGFQVENIE